MQELYKTQLKIIKDEERADKDAIRSNLVTMRHILKNSEGSYKFIVDIEGNSQFPLFDASEIFVCSRANPDNRIYLRNNSFVRDSTIIEINASLVSKSNIPQMDNLLKKNDLQMGLLSSLNHYAQQIRGLERFVLNEDEDNQLRIFPEQIMNILANLQPIPLLNCDFKDGPIDKIKQKFTPIKTRNDEGQYVDITLNEPQIRAIYATLKNYVTLIEGPPGTGKTYIISQICGILDQKFMDSEISVPIEKSQYKTLVLSNKNEACDNVLEVLIKMECYKKPYSVMRKNSVYKKSSKETISSLCLDSVIEAQIENNNGENLLDKDLFQKFNETQNCLISKQESLAQLYTVAPRDDVTSLEIRQLKQEITRYRQLKESIYRSLLVNFISQHVEVVVATFASGATFELKNVLFKTVIIDEASCVAPADTYLAATRISNISSGKMVMVGDVMQLG